MLLSPPFRKGRSGGIGLKMKCLLPLAKGLRGFGLGLVFENPPQSPFGKGGRWEWWAFEKRGKMGMVGL